MTELVNRALNSDMDAQTSLYMQTKNKAYTDIMVCHSDGQMLEG